MTFDLSWLRHRLETKEYFSDKNLDNSLIANDIRQTLIRGGVDVVDFLLDGKIYHHFVITQNLYGEIYTAKNEQLVPS